MWMCWVPVYTEQDLDRRHSMLWGTSQEQCDVHSARSFWETKRVSMLELCSGSLRCSIHPIKDTHTAPGPKAQRTLQKRAERRKSRRTGSVLRACVSVMSGVPSYTLSPWLPKRELNMDDTNRHARVHRERSPWGPTLHKEPQTTEECWEWEKRFSSGTVPQLVFQYRMVNPESMHTSKSV